MSLLDLDATTAGELVGDIAARIPGVQQFHFMPDEFFGESNTDFVSLQHGAVEDSFVIAAGSIGTDIVAIRFSRAQMHQLHAALGEVLGLTTPTPTSPLTASVPADNPRNGANG